MENTFDSAFKELLGVLKENVTETAGLVPIGVSNRHIHLSEADLFTLFGQGYELTSIKDLSQPGQFACKEMLHICGSKGVIESVRVLGPVRPDTQVELLMSDCFKLGIKPCLRLSGDIDGSPGVTLVGPKGSVILSKGAIVAKRHIHMTAEDAIRFNVSDGDKVGISLESERGGLLKEVVIRVTKTSKLDCHIDTEEANAIGLGKVSEVQLVK